MTATTTFSDTAELLLPPAELWGIVRDKLKTLYGEAIFRSWIRAIECRGVEEGRLTLAVPTRFMREWIQSHYGQDIRRLCQQLNDEIDSVEILVDGQRHSVAEAPPVQPMVKAAPETPAPITVPATVAEEASVAIGPAEINDGQMVATLDPRCTFENFIIGKPNELAHAAARRVAESPNVVPGCNPLFLYGGVGLGKTHLMHAIAWHIRHTNPNRRVVYLSAEKFMYQFIRALRAKEAFAFKEYFRSVDVLMIDDVQFISGKDSTQEEFFHTFNALVDQHKQLVISADRSPSDLDGVEERIRSRLGWGLVADIHATTYELRLSILQSKVEAMPQLDVPVKVVEFLAHKITSNVRELEGALNRVVAHSTLVGRPITLESTQEVLRDLLRANDRRITIEDIQKHVATHYNIKVSEMHSARRSRAVARPRQVAMYLAKKLTTKSLPEIGRRFGGKDHTTVMHAVKRVEELIATDGEFSQDVEMLTRMIRS